MHVSSPRFLATSPRRDEQGEVANEPVSESRGFPVPDPDEPRGRIAGWIVLTNGERLGVTVHCVDRFWERAAVGCTLFRHALARLQELTAAIGAEGPRPQWAGPAVAAERWIELGPDIGLVARRYAAVTCLVRGATPDPRRRRTRRKAGRRRRQAYIDPRGQKSSLLRRVVSRASTARHVPGPPHAVGRQP